MTLIILGVLIIFTKFLVLPSHNCCDFIATLSGRQYNRLNFLNYHIC